MASSAFEELDYWLTPLGELILRRREVASLDRAEVFEVKLDGQFLMSSLVTDAEIALAEFALPLVTCEGIDVLVGGLGLGYTAKAALDSKKVRSVTVIEFLHRVIGWHLRGLIPLAKHLTEDPRCRLIHGDFFAAMGSPATDGVGQVNQVPERSIATGVVEEGHRPALPNSRFHAILLDIDHSPQCLLREDHASFYTAAGMKRLTQFLHPGGVFAVWSADPPEESFVACLESAFRSVEVRESKFRNPLLNRDDVNYIFLARLS